MEMEVDPFIKFTGESTIAYVLQELRDKLNGLLTRFLLNVDKFHYSENDEILIEGVAKILELEDEKAGFKINYEGIGSRPRVITRSFGAAKSRRELEMSYQSTSTNNMQNLSIQTPVAQMPDAYQHFKKEIAETKEDNCTKAMRYFMVKLNIELVKTLKAKTVVLIEADAKLPSAFIDALIEFEVNDRVSRKIIVFHSDDVIVGVGMLMDPCVKQIKRELLKLFFQSNKQINLQQLR